MVPEGTYVSALVADIDQIFTGLHARRELILPDLRAVGRLFITTDIGGEARGSRHVTYSFFVTASSAWSMVSDSIADIRRRHSLPARRGLEFKHRKRGGRARVYREVAEVIGRIPSFLLTVAVRKDVPTLYGDQFIAEALEVPHLHGMKRDSVERLLTLAHTAGYLAAVLRAPEQRTMWYVDRDKALQTKRMTHIACNTFQQIQRDLVGHPPPELGFATEFSHCDDDSNVDLGFFLAVPDLFAGIVSKVLRDAESGDGRYDVGDEPAIPLVHLLAGQSVGMKHLTLVVEPGQPRFVSRVATVSSSGGKLSRSIISRFDRQPG
jgi:hypothetical protein